jgi:GntR family transcriptional regulator
MLDLIMEHGLLGGSVSKTMTAAGMVAVSGEQDVTARPLPADFAQLLDTEPGTVFLHTTRVNSDADGRVVEIVISYLDPQCFSLHLTYGK